MKKFIPILITTLCFSEDTNILYKQAMELENQGNYKEAMLLYKKIASSNFSKEDKYIIDLSKNEEHKVDTYSTIKKIFIRSK